MPTSYDENKITRVKHLAAVLQDTKTRIADTIKYVSCANNVISFFKTSDGSGTAAYTVSLPNELVLDQLKTQFVPSFAFSATTYPGATDPSLEGKPVLVIAIKDTNAAGTTTTTYSFLDMTSLVDVYTIATGDSAKVLSIANNAITVHVSAGTGNHLTVANDGLMVDVSDKADKVTGATAGNIATLDAIGNLVDSGTTFATDAEITAMIADVYSA